VTSKLVARAEAAGFSALVLTVDAPYFGRRLADARNRFQLPKHLSMANFTGLGQAEKGVNQVGFTQRFCSAIQLDDYVSTFIVYSEHTMPKFS
jgi:(S)-2-hydroxy-acid oxidase